MRIAFVLLDGEVTGGQMVAHELMRAARAAGHEPLAVFPAAGPMLARLDADELAYRVLPLDRSFRLDQAAVLARLLRAERIDVVNTHTLFVGDQLARLAARLGRVPLVAHAHIDERFSERPLVARPQRAAARASARMCNTFVAVSHHVAGVLVDQGVPESRIIVVHNGIRVTPDVVPPPDGELRVVCVARLAPVKGQALLLEALQRVGPGVRATFAGEDLEHGGEYRRKLEELADTLRVAAQVEFLGHRNDVRALIERSHALVLPSLAEGLPVVALEAMERGRAVVGAASGGTPEVVADGETGLLVEPGSVADLASALLRLRDEPELAQRLGRGGRARIAREFTLEQMTGRTLAVLEHAATVRRKSVHS
jgi:glycosyltransferase involved in cell wall biosynthesis